VCLFRYVGDRDEAKEVEEVKEVKDRNSAALGWSVIFRRCDALSVVAVEVGIFFFQAG